MNNEKSQVNIKDYWGVLTRRKELLLLPLMIIPLVALAITYFMQPTYMSSVTILLSESKILPATVEQEIEGRPDYSYARLSTQERQSSYLSQITSTEFLRRLIAVLNLPIDDRIKSAVASAKGQYPEISENELAENIMADQLRNDVGVTLRTNNVIEVTFNASDPVSAQKKAKTLADIFIEENLAQELAGVRSNITFSQEQLAFYKDKLKTAEDRLRDYRQALLTSSVEQDTSSTNLQQIVSAVEALDLEISRQEDNLMQLRGGLIADSIDVNGIALPSEIANQKDRLIGTISKLSDLLTNYTWKDSKVLSLNEEARAMLDAINKNIRTFVDSRYSDKPQALRDRIVEYLIGTASIDFDTAKQATLNKSIGKIKSRLGQDPATEITMQRLQSEIDTYKKFYDLFVSHSQNAAINQSAKKVEAEAKYTIIKPASLPLSPDSPKRLKIFGMGIALGLALGFGAIIVIELVDNSFKKVEDVTDYLRVPVLGTIPRIDLPYPSSARKKAPIVLGTGISILLIVLIVFLNFKKSG